MKSFRIDAHCDICLEKWVVIGHGKLPESLPCPKCEHPCDVRHAFCTPDDGFGDDEEDNEDNDGLVMAGKE